MNITENVDMSKSELEKFIKDVFDSEMKMNKEKGKEEFKEDVKKIVKKMIKKQYKTLYDKSNFFIDNL